MSTVTTDIQPRDEEYATTLAWRGREKSDGPVEFVDLQ
jgi:hypothetical protein